MINHRHIMRKKMRIVSQTILLNRCADAAKDGQRALFEIHDLRERLAATASNFDIDKIRALAAQAQRVTALVNAHIHR